MGLKAAAERRLRERLVKLEALVAERFKCPQCGMIGKIDSGGSDPQGNWIEVECPTCREIAELKAKVKELEKVIADFESGDRLRGASDSM